MTGLSRGAPASLLQLAELARRVANLIRYGTVRELDYERGLARAAWDSGEGAAGSEVLTGWLPLWTRMAGEDRDWRPPSPGETCAIFSPGGEMAAGFILAGFSSAAHPAPSDSESEHALLYRDAARMSYDPTTHLLRAALPDGAVLSYDGEAHRLAADLPDGGKAALGAPAGLEITGPVTVKGDLTVRNARLCVRGRGADIEADGNATVGGNLAAVGNVEGAQVSDTRGSMAEMRGVFNPHTHPLPGLPPSNTLASPAKMT